MGNREEFDRGELERMGRMLWDPRMSGRVHPMLRGRTVGEFLAEAILKVRGKDGRLHPLKANAVQRQYERRRGEGNIVLKARQMGMTTWVAGRMFLKTICRPGTVTVQVAHTQEAAEEMLGIVHRFVEHLPKGLKVGVLKTSRSSVRQIRFPAIDSEYRVVSAADRNAGRGMTFQNLHCSEVARWEGDAAVKGPVAGAEILAGLRAGLAPGGEQVLESTPCGVGGCFFDEWTQGVESGLVRHFFPWWTEPGYRWTAVERDSLTEEERELVRRAGLTLEQIGFRRRMERGQKGLARQEFVEDAETCFLVSGEPYFELEALERRMAEAPEPIQRRANGRMEVWLPPLVGKRYVVAVDPAGGGAEGDFSAIEVLDLETGMQCAEFAGHVGGRELMELARQTAWDYNTAWLVVERNNHGSEQLGLLEAFGYREIYRGADGQKGFLTTSVSRPQVLAGLSAALVEAPGLFQSKRLLGECRTFVRRADGRAGARSGAHDDRVMAMAIGLAARGELLGRRRGTGTGT